MRQATGIGRWILIAAFSLSASQARAWGSLGHRAAALIAQERLSPAALKGVRDILGGSVGLDKIAACPDGMIHAVGTFDCGGAFSLPADPSKTTQPWHYIDIPLSASPSASSLAGYCLRGTDCVVEQIRKNEKVLADPGSPLQTRRVALMYLVHLAADEHQPLHCADDADRGGNEKPAVLYGRRKDLHMVWDDLIMAEGWKEQASMDAAPLAGELRSEIARGDAAEWTKGDFIAAAALESFAVAKNGVYPQYAKDRGRNLGDAYKKQMEPVIKRRLAMAGVRLAAILEKALGRP